MKQSFLTLSCINYLSGNIICQKIDDFVTMLYGKDLGTKKDKNGTTTFYIKR